jgi:hypothetical protein
MAYTPCCKSIKIMKPEIKKGMIVKRIHSEHGSMSVGDVSTVVDRVGNCVKLKKDAHRNYEHDVRRLVVFDE